MKQPYSAPRIVDERSLEAEAMACLKTPGQGFSNPTFCGPVHINRNSQIQGCAFNPNSRSS